MGSADAVAETETEGFGPFSDESVFSEEGVFAGEVGLATVVGAGVASSAVDRPGASTTIERTNRTIVCASFWAGIVCPPAT